MPYYRRPYKRTRYGKTIKYSVQQKAFQFTATGAASSAQVIVPATTLEGMRKVKHLTVSLSGESAVGNIYWALVYVPQGTTAQSITVSAAGSTTAMYEPNQFVMNCGIVDIDAGPIRFSYPIARNLNDGDAIYLVVRPVASGTFTILGTVRYAISLQ